MTKVDFFGHFFYASLFFGMLLLQAKDFRGWAFRLAGEVGWIGIGLIMGMSSIWAWGFAFLAVDVMGYIKWKKEEKDLAELEPELADWFKMAHERICNEEPQWTITTQEVEAPPVKKVRKNVKRKAKAKRNPPVKRQSKGKKVAAKRSRTPNRKVQPRRGRSGK